MPHARNAAWPQGSGAQDSSATRDVGGTGEPRSGARLPGSAPDSATLKNSLDLSAPRFAHPRGIAVLSVASQAVLTLGIVSA